MPNSWKLVECMLLCGTDSSRVWSKRSWQDRKLGRQNCDLRMTMIFMYMCVCPF